MASNKILVSRRAILAGAGSMLLVSSASRVHSQAAPETASDGFHVLRAKSATASLAGDGKPATPAWSYSNLVPGPTLRVRRGAELKVRLINELTQPTAIHWHGIRGPNAMDGVPHLTQAPVEAGKQFDYRFAPPEAGTYWYHAPLSAPEQNARGLSGALIVDEERAVDADRELVLLIQSFDLLASGEIDPQTWEQGAQRSRSGVTTVTTVNGKPSLDVEVRTNERLRMRLINATSARIVALRLEGMPCIVSAIDGQPAEAFAPRQGRVQLGPGNRVDLFADAAITAGASASLILESEGGGTPLVRFTLATGAPARAEPRKDIPSLPATSLPARMDFARSVRAELPLGGEIKPAKTESGKAAGGPYGPALFNVKRGRTVMLAIPNRTATAQVVHVHGHQFRLLDALDDGWKPYWLDTLIVDTQRTSRIAFVADNPGKWLIESHPIRAGGVSFTWFEVT
ncbi:MAG: hypothetical protein QOD74_2635 [Variibacter sp.]|jgi:FtsP/CotA-like multicopper oxidase with cupredoxin domain|nr:hypothetical protein [Variibacter sp.]